MEIILWHTHAVCNPKILFRKKNKFHAHVREKISGDITKGICHGSGVMQHIPWLNWYNVFLPAVTFVPSVLLVIIFRSVPEGNWSVLERTSCLQG